LIEIAAFAGQDALKAKRRAAAPIIRFGCHGRGRAASGKLGGAHPVEPINGHDEAMLIRPPQHVTDLDQRILDMSGDDLDIVFIEGDELEFVRARTHPIASLVDLSPVN
jgi:hypothetical protein